MKRGKVVLTPFPFTDLSSKKNRPALVISKNATRHGDVILAFISSKIQENHEETDLLLRQSDKEFLQTGLKRDSFICLGKLVTVDQEILLGELGELSPRTLKLVNKKLKLALGL